jgi:hypothetical protein
MPGRGGSVSQPWVRVGPDCCGHWNYRKATVEGLMFCLCADCGHRWITVLCPNQKEFDGY